MIPVPGAPPDTFSPVSPIADQPLSEDKIQVQQRSKEKFGDPVNPAMHYGNPPPRPAPWGRPVKKTGEPIFTYTENGELKHDRELSRSQMREYLYGYPCGGNRKQDGRPWVERQPLPGEQRVRGKLRHGLTIWIGWTPTQSNQRYPHAMSNKCRFKDCAIDTRAIKSGQLRVAFDERMNVNGKFDPFHCAGYVHLFCLEKQFDLLKLMDQLDVRLDCRSFDKEMKNLADLDNHGTGRTRTALNWLSREWPRLEQHEHNLALRRTSGDLLTRGQAERPRHFDDSLTKAIMVYDNANYQRAGRDSRLRRRRCAIEEAAAEGREPRQICDADAHMGNLDYVQVCEDKRRCRGDCRVIKAEPEAEPTRICWLESPVPPENYGPWMFTDGFIPGRVERLVPREPLGITANQYVPQIINQANSAFFQHGMTQIELGHIKSEYGGCDDSSYWLYDPPAIQPSIYDPASIINVEAEMSGPVYPDPDLLGLGLGLDFGLDLDLNLKMEPGSSPNIAPASTLGLGPTPQKRCRDEGYATDDERPSAPKKVCTGFDELIPSHNLGASMVPEGSIDPWARIEPIQAPEPVVQMPPVDGTEQGIEQNIGLDQYVHGEMDLLDGDKHGDIDDLFADDGSFDFGAKFGRPSPITVPNPGEIIPRNASEAQGKHPPTPKTAVVFPLASSKKRKREEDEDDIRDKKPRLRRALTV